MAINKKRASRIPTNENQLDEDSVCARFLNDASQSLTTGYSQKDSFNRPYTPHRLAGNPSAVTSQQRPQSKPTTHHWTLPATPIVSYLKELWRNCGSSTKTQTDKNKTQHIREEKSMDHARDKSKSSQEHILREKSASINNSNELHTNKKPLSTYFGSDQCLPSTSQHKSALREEYRELSSQENRSFSKGHWQKNQQSSVNTRNQPCEQNKDNINTSSYRHIANLPAHIRETASHSGMSLSSVSTTLSRQQPPEHLDGQNPHKRYSTSNLNGPPSKRPLLERSSSYDTSGRSHHYRPQLDYLNHDSTRHHNKMEKLKQLLGNVVTSVKEMKTRISVLKEKIEATRQIQEKIVSMSASVTAQEERSRRIVTGIKALEEADKDLTKSWDTRLRQHKSKVKKIDKTRNKVNNRIAEITKTLEAVNERAHDFKNSEIDVSEITTQFGNKFSNLLATKVDVISEYLMERMKQYKEKITKDHLETKKKATRSQRQQNQEQQDRENLLAKATLAKPSSKKASAKRKKTVTIRKKKG